ncbi:MAG: UvrD-helicase domain-containing protein, partial [Acidobacteriaceae bacterium]
MTTTSNLPADSTERERALAIEQSFLVRAPAGSGKTELLTRRFLKLLAAVDDPEEILAITFTRAATAEMRGRVLGYLETAARETADPDENEEISLARAVLAHSEARGWRLLEQPHRLNIQTIDSLCLSIARNQPLLSRMGGGLAPTENAKPLYAEAARRTLERLGSNQALKHLLALRDNNLAECAELIAGMLDRRDQWIRAFPLAGEMGEEDWERARSHLEQPFRDEIKRVHGEVYRLLMTQPALATELVDLARYACGNGNRAVATLEVLRELPRPDLMETEQWRCLANFLLTGNEWRKASGLNSKAGFPLEGKKEKLRMGALLERFFRVGTLREALCAARVLPEPRYDEQQWETLKHIFMVLRLAVAELQVLFAERNTVDFTELSIAASMVLDTDASPEVLLALSGNIRHLLVDEFQDTSRSQLMLLQKLIRAWEQVDGRTCFLVGDPMQSIYLFRQAEVELFDQVARAGLVAEEHTVECELVELTTNFRSHEGLTSCWNEMFAEVFGKSAGAGHIEYAHTFGHNPALPGGGVEVHPQIIGGADGKMEPGERDAARVAEAEQVLEIVAGHREQIQRAVDERGEYRVAILVRSRPHLAHIVKLLREREIPFRAVELEKLNERQELIDLMSLVRALLHPMDRVAWLSVLRAPWCGLTLDDLHRLTGTDDPAFRKLPMLDLISLHLPLLSADGAARLR